MNTKLISNFFGKPVRTDELHERIKLRGSSADRECFDGSLIQRLEIENYTTAVESRPVNL